MYISTFVSEEIAVANGDIDRYFHEIDVDDD